MKRHLPVSGNSRAPLFGRIEPVFPLSNDIGRLFDGFFDSVFDFGTEPKNGSRSIFSPSLNMTESEEALHLNLEVPGMTEDELDLSLSEGYLTIKGEKQKDYDEENGKVHFVGRSYGSFEKRIPIGKGVDESKIEASVKNGVLNVTLPKKEEEKEKVKKICVKSD